LKHHEFAGLAEGRRVAIFWRCKAKPEVGPNTKKAYKLFDELTTAVWSRSPMRWAVLVAAPSKSRKTMIDIFKVLKR
jgi:hypothetical protein